MRFARRLAIGDNAKSGDKPSVRVGDASQWASKPEEADIKGRQMDEKRAWRT